MGVWDSVFAAVFGRRGPRRRSTPSQPTPTVPASTSPPSAPPAQPAPPPVAPPPPAPTPVAAETPTPTPPPAAEAPPPVVEPSTPTPPPVAEAPPPPPVAEEPAPAPPGEPSPSPSPEPASGETPGEPAREPAGTHDIGAPHEPPAEPAPEPSAPPAPAAAALVWTDGWNPAIPPERRLQSPNRRARGDAAINRIIIHITGTGDFASAKNSFMSEARQASAHYCIDRNGDLYQFVPEDDVAWHAGINRSVDSVYAPRDGGWRKFKRYFSWHQGYPSDAVYLNQQMQPCAPGQAALVARGDGAPWPDYEFFDKRWGQKPEPVGYEISKQINQHSIGIETVGFGGDTAAAYTDKMYETLAALVADLCARHNIPRKFGPVCGHEDADPVERWGWDPGKGFDWSRIVEM